MAQVTKILGPPGAGKTTRLTALFIAAAERYGPERIAAVTYTRAAANELRERVAKALGIKADWRTLNRQMPYVGTIHSLAYRALGLSRANVANERLSEFCSSVGIEMPDYVPTDPEYAEGFWWGEGMSRLESEALFRTIGAARHQMITLDEAFEQVPLQMRIVTDLARIHYLAAEYTMWKYENKLLDFEDILQEGAKVPLPVRMLVLDEAQDCSKLMMQTVGAWADGQTVRRFYAAGDPYQAIYRFQGASPDLFLNMPGEWAHLKRSHRMGPAGVAYAKDILNRGGFPGALDFFEGHGGLPIDGSVFYLARTHNLVSQFEDELRSAGTPYVSLRGRSSPWQSKAGDAYRAVLDLETIGVIPVTGLKAIADSLPSGYLPYGVKAEIGRMRGEVGWPDFMGSELARAKTYIQNAAYFEKVVTIHGMQAMFKRPKVGVSTIHGAKGREADTVYLADSWARLPARTLAQSEEGRQAESCVAYVGATRHRVELHLVPGMDGVPYPFP